MTREEAIEALYELAQGICLIESTPQGKAMRMAIKALEQEPCEDAISRQAVLDLAKKGVLISNGSYKSVCKAINEIPAVDPQNCDQCEVGNPCLYCKHEFDPQERSDKE